MKEYRFQVSGELSGERVDKALTVLVDFLSRSYIQKQIKAGGVTIGEMPAKAGTRVTEGDEITICVPDSVQPDIRPEPIPLDILYEDEDVLVVNKPKGMVVHPAAGHYNGTLVNAVLAHCGDSLSGINGVLRPGIVHRIDKDTTGSVIICKNDMAHLSLAQQLKEHRVTRAYHALCCGNLMQESGVIDTMIGRDAKDRKKMAVQVGGGKRAVTHYRVLQRFNGYTYVECRLETGRTHQIRVHMASLGHPLLGDEVYGNRKCPFRLEGQTLHAKLLGFTHPRSGEYIETDAPLPEYFQHLLEIL